MKKFIIALFLSLSLIPSSAQNNYILDPTNISNDSFSDASNGFGVSLILGQKTGKGITNNFIQVTLKNDTTTDKFYSTVPSICQMEFYYVDATGAQIPMSDYKYDMNIPSENQPITIKPGHTLSRIINVKNSDLAILQSKPIILKASIFNGTDFVRVISPQKSLTTSP